MSATKSHYAIVGGGLLGLTVAMRLAERGHRVTVLEAADHLGGLADAWQLGNVTWDRHYHVTLLSDQYLRSLLKQLGLDDQMQWVETRTGFLVDGQLHSLSSTWEFLRFPPLNLWNKLRLGWTIFFASKLRDWRRLEEIPVGEWLTKHSGRKTFERIWLPLLKAKLGDAWQRTSAAFIWTTIARMYAARRTGLKKELFGYLPGGYQRMLTAFEERLETLGVEIRTSCSADSITGDSDGTLNVTTTDGESLPFDRVVVTTPTPVASRICPQLSTAELKKLDEVEYLGIVCASVLLTKGLSGYYVTNITDEAPFTGVIEMTALVKPEHLRGHHLVYLPKYVAAGDPILQQTDDEIRELFLTALERMYPAFSRDHVLALRISRVRHVFALSTLGYSRRVPGIETSMPGLYLVNSAQIVNGTLNVNETVRLAEESIDTLCRPLAVPLPVTNTVPRISESLTQTVNEHEDDRELVARPG